MILATATQAGQLATQIGVLQKLVADIETAIAEKWLTRVVHCAAPDTGSSKPAGTVLDVLPFGDASADVSALVLSTALQTYQTQLDALNAQLAAL